MIYDFPYILGTSSPFVLEPIASLPCAHVGPLARSKTRTRQNNHHHSSRGAIWIVRRGPCWRCWPLHHHIYLTRAASLLDQPIHPRKIRRHKKQNVPPPSPLHQVESENNNNNNLRQEKFKEKEQFVLKLSRFWKQKIYITYSTWLWNDAEREMKTMNRWTPGASG